MGIYLKEKDSVSPNCRAFGPLYKIRNAAKNKFELRGIHLHPHAIRRSY